MKKFKRVKIEELEECTNAITMCDGDLELVKEIELYANVNGVTRLVKFRGTGIDMYISE